MTHLTVKLMTRFLFFFLLIWTLPCKSQNQKIKNKITIIKKYDYCITIDMENAFWGHSSKFILNNLYIDNYDSNSSIPLTKPLTLYYITNQRYKSDTTQTAISKLQSDTLFNLTTAFFRKFVFNNYDTAINNVITKQEITDDSQATVELSYGGRVLRATMSNISNPAISTKEFDRLKSYVGKFVPADIK